MVMMLFPVCVYLEQVSKCVYCCRSCAAAVVVMPVDAVIGRCWRALDVKEECEGRGVGVRGVDVRDLEI